MCEWIGYERDQHRASCTVCRVSATEGGLTIQFNCPTEPCRVHGRRHKQQYEERSVRLAGGSAPRTGKADSDEGIEPDDGN